MTINTGTGDDALKVHTYMDGSNVSLGDGADKLEVTQYVYNSAIDTGAGADNITIGSSPTSGNTFDAWSLYSATLNTQDGDDKVRLEDGLYLSNVNLGAGNDYIEIAGVICQQFIGHKNSNLTNHF